MSIGKSPGNDGLTVEFYTFFWDDIKNLLFESLKHSCISQRQAIIKLIEKRDKDKCFIQNWRPISLLNVDTKIISKCIASFNCGPSNCNFFRSNCLCLKGVILVKVSA